jgi:hypothetical protein
MRRRRRAWTSSLILLSKFGSGSLLAKENGRSRRLVSRSCFRCRPSTRLQGDIIILAPASNAHALRQADALPTPSSLLTRFAFSEALSRSSQLSVLEGVSSSPFLSSLCHLFHERKLTLSYRFDSILQPNSTA